MFELQPIGAAEPILLDDTPLLRHPLEQVVEHARPEGSICLFSDIFTSAYGVHAFLLSDSNPEPGRFVYAEGDSLGEISEQEWEGHTWDGKNRHNLSMKCKSMEVPGNVKFLRYFVMPHEVDLFFQSDTELGPAFLSKITTRKHSTKERLVPEEYREMQFPFRLLGKKQQEYHAFLSKIGFPTCVDPGFPMSLPTSHVAYQSFHMFYEVPIVQPRLQAALLEGLANFDSFLARADAGGQLSRREITTAGDVVRYGSPTRRQIDDG